MKLRAGRVRICRASDQRKIGANQDNVCFQSAICVSGGVYNPASDLCTLPNSGTSCPTNYNFDAALGQCVHAPTCASGGYHVGRDRCELPVDQACSTGTYNPVSGKCEQPPTCGSGTVYHAGRDRCEAPLQPCPTGFGWDPGLDQCVASALCSDGSVLNPSTDKCELPAPQTCSSGYTLNGATGLCESTPTCVAPGVYSPTANTCQADPTGTTCSSGYTFNVGLGLCTAAPTCASGTFVVATGRCEATPGYSCPTAGYTYVASENRCERAPVCSIGTYNTTYNKCLTASSPGCPAGYSYISSRNRCERTPTCSSGTYNPTTNACVTTTTSSYPATPVYSVCTIIDRVIGTTFTYNIPPNVTDYYFRGSIKQIHNATISSTCVITQRLVRTPQSAPPVIYSVYIPPGTSADFGPPTVAGPRYGMTNTSTPVGYSCPSGGTLSGTTCTVTTTTNSTPNCPSGDMDYLYDVCHATNNPQCSSGTYDAVIGSCVVNPTCTGGDLDGSRDVCYQGATAGCSGGMVLTGGVCIVAPTCTGGTYSSALAQCTSTASNNCPSGGFVFNAAAGKCEAGASCGAPGALNTSSDKCETPYILACPGGFSLGGSLCSTNPACSGTGTYSAAADKCTNGNNVCAAGQTLDVVVDLCSRAATCASGVLNTGSDLCQADSTQTCSGGMQLDSTNGVCQAAATCSAGGSLSGSIDRCAAPATYLCQPGYDSASGVCIRTPDCGAPGGINPARDRCETVVVTSCGAGFTLNGGVCSQSQTCTAPGAYSNPLDQCLDSVSKVCDPGLALELSTSTCWVAAACAGGALNTGSDQCEAPAAVNCGTLSWDSALQVCYTPKVCSPGLYSTTDNRCETTITYNCGSMDYDAPSGKCVANPQCSTDAAFPGTQQFEFTRTLGVCVNPPKVDCSEGTSYFGPPVRMCESIVQCPNNSIYDVATNTCSGVGGGTICPAGDFPCAPTASSAQIIKGCPNGGSLDSAKKICVRDGIVVSGAVDLSDYYFFYPEVGVPNRLVTDLLLGGPGLGDKSYLEFAVSGGRVVVTGKMWQDGYWSAEGQGETIVWSDATGMVVGTLTLTHANGLVTVSGLPVVIPDVLDLRPTDGQMAFYTPGGGMAGSITLAPKLIEEAPLTEAETFCSPNACTPDPSIDEEPAFEDYQNDGTIDPATGECIGQVKIFSGKGKYCLKSGVKTSFFNCCNPDPASFLFIQKVCPTMSTEVAFAQTQERAHYIGDFCVSKWPAVGCVQTAKVFCVFESKLARIVHDQGRIQLKAFQPDSGWGTPQQPNCEGFSPAQFSAIDFGKLDLSEAFPDIMPTVNGSKIQEDATNAIQKFFAK